MRVRFFEDARAFRRWLAAHHRTETELWVGFRRVGSGLPTVTYPEAVDEALCVGWIDGVRHRLDDTSYTNRFTPRKPDSFWSQINIGRAEALIARGRMKRAGLAAFARRSDARQQRHADGQRPRALPPAARRRFRTHRTAWAFFTRQAPWYRRAAVRWVMSAVREATRDRRLETLIADSAAGRRIAPLAGRRTGTRKR